jgi:hypothetical protein
MVVLTILQVLVPLLAIIIVRRRGAIGNERCWRLSPQPLEKPTC